MNAAENARNLAAIKEAQKKQPPRGPVAPPPPPVPTKQQLLEMALRIANMASAMPTPGISETRVWSDSLAGEARTLKDIAESL